MKTVKFNLTSKGDVCTAKIDGTPRELVELITAIMIKNDVCARLILASTEVYNLQKKQE